MQQLFFTPLLTIVLPTMLFWLLCVMLCAATGFIVYKKSVALKKAAANDTVLPAADRASGRLHAVIEMHEQLSHDAKDEMFNNIGQELSLACHRTERLIDEGVDAADILSILHNAVSDLRYIGYMLTTDLKWRGGLAGAVEKDLKHLAKRRSMETDFSSEASFEAEAGQSVLFYTAFRVAVRNLLESTATGKMKVALSSTGPMLSMTVTDNSLRVTASQEVRLRMSNISQQLRELNGTLTTNTDTTGTNLIIKIPRDEKL